MKKLLSISLFLSVSFYLYSQSNLGNYDINYTYVVFEDNFTGITIDESKWHPGLIHRGKGELIYDTLTHKVSNDHLELMMKLYPNYNDSSDFVGAEFVTNSTFLYGIFECEASYANGVGSWPAFWSMHQLPCPDNEGPEIDFAEYSCESSSYKKLSLNIHHWAPVQCGENGYQIETDYHYKYSFTPSTNQYKSIWTPEKIEYYVDNVLKKTYYNNETDWFPDRPVAVIVSQQINNADSNNLEVPQTSFFNYVRIKKFFPVPEISCPDVICSSSTALLDVDSLASNITWSLTPGYQFLEPYAGNGKIANINPTSYNGTGKITYSFQMPSGETFTKEKTFGVKGPRNEDISLTVYKSDGTLASKINGTWLMCPNTTYHIYVSNNYSTCSTTDYTWTVPSAWTTFYTYQNMISINTNSFPGGPVSVQAITCCNNNATVISTDMGANYNCSNYYMTLSPNPDENETLLSIGSESEDLKIDEQTWEIEIYDQNQLLKERISKITGKEYKLKISGWKKGVYFIMAIIKGDVLNEKLIVQ